MNRQNWTSDEDNKLCQVVRNNGSDDWTKNAELLRELSATALVKNRTGKQCRERWYNHLDPAVVKTRWTIHEQAQLFEMHKQHGNKWKELSKHLPGRTDNDIKNHFYSTLRRSLRRLNKYSGEKNSTTQMREIKPSVLTFIVNHIYSQEANASQNRNLIDSLKQLPELIFKFSNFKPVKHNMDTKIDENLKSRISTIMNLVENFKELYRKEKNQDIDAHEPNKQPKQKIKTHHTLSLTIQANSNKFDTKEINEKVEEVEDEDEQVQDSYQTSQIHQQFNQVPQHNSLEQVWMSNKSQKSKENRQFVPIVTIQRTDPQSASKKLIMMPKTEEKISQLKRQEEKVCPLVLSLQDEEDLNDVMMPIEDPSVSLNENSHFFSDLVVIGKHIQPISYLVTNEAQNYAEIDEILYQNYQD